MRLLGLSFALLVMMAVIILVPVRQEKPAAAPVQTEPAVVPAATFAKQVFARSRAAAGQPVLESPVVGPTPSEDQDVPPSRASSSPTTPTIWSQSAEFAPPER